MTPPFLRLYLAPRWLSVVSRMIPSMCCYVITISVAVEIADGVASAVTLPCVLAPDGGACYLIEHYLHVLD